MNICKAELLLSLHLCDSGLPVGSLAHSSGLESAVQSGFVTNDTESLTKYIVISLEQIIAQFLPFVDAAHQLTAQSFPNQSFNYDRFLILDNRCNLILSTNEVAHRASISQGIYSLILQTSW